MRLLAGLACRGCSAVLCAIRDLQLFCCDLEATDPGNCTQLSAVTQLDCSYVSGGGSSDAAVRALVGQAPLLRSLRLVACFDSELPESVVRLSGMQRLALELNGMDTLPAGAYLSGLQWLSLREGFLPQLPPALAAVTALTSLLVQSLAASLPTAEVDADGVAAVLTQLACLQTLKLANCRLALLPAAALAGMSALQRLDLSDNDFAALPASLSQATALRQLNLSGNMHLAPAAEQLGAVLAHLPLLEGLDLSGCWLMELPACVLCCAACLSQ